MSFSHCTTLFLLFVEKMGNLGWQHMMSLKQTTHTNNLQGIEEKTEHGQHTRFNVVRFP